jgi:tetratricopeptide (TPR) repeat protein
VPSLGCLTTSQFEKMYLRPRTSRRRCSVIDELATDAATEHHVGRATWFVSHTWHNPFADTLEAILNFFEGRRDAANAVVWFDIFVDSQHATGPIKPPQWYMTTFKSSIARIGSLLLVVDKWSNPSPLRRAWYVHVCVRVCTAWLTRFCRCVLELHAIAEKAGGTFAVAMTGQEKKRFLRGISKDPGAYYRMLGTVNVESSDCSRPEDRESIHAGIRDSVGFGELGRMVFGVMEKWMVQELERQLVSNQYECNYVAVMRWSNSLACVLRDQGRHDEAVVLGEKALNTAQRFFGENNSRLGHYMCNLAITYKAQLQFEKALSLEERTLELYQRMLAKDEERISNSRFLFCLFSDHGLEEKADRLEQRVLEFEERFLPRRRRDIGKSMGNLAATYSLLGRLDDALAMQERALEFRRRELYPSHPDIGESMNNLGSAYSDLGRHDDALAMKKKALEFRQNILPAHHPHIAISMCNLAATYSHLGRHDDALAMQERALEFRLRVLPPNHPDIGESMNNLATKYSDLDRYDDALAMKKKALEFQRRVLPSSHPDIDLGSTDANAESSSIQLGDIIQIMAPTNQEIHEHMFFIDYASSRKINLIDTDTLERTVLQLDATGQLTDESITSIHLLSRAKHEGFARQNNLVVSTWVDIRFGGDSPTTITGMITNLECDMIEIRTYPEDQTIYIDFGYMGIPENLPIEKITIRAPPIPFVQAEPRDDGPYVLPKNHRDVSMRGWDL